MKALLVVPAYNEEANIVSVARSIEEKGYDYVVVNDGSSDGTRQLCIRHNIPLLDLSQNLGIGGAVQAGHKYALQHGYDVDIQFDGDGQHDINYVEDLLREIDGGADLAIGSRFVQGYESSFQSTFMRRVGIKWLSVAIRLFSGMKITDPTSGFRACGKRAMELFARDYPIDYPEPESIVDAAKAGLCVRETHVEMHERAGGSSSIRALSSIYYMIKVSIAIAIAGLSRSR